MIDDSPVKKDVFRRLSFWFLTAIFVFAGEITAAIEVPALYTADVTLDAEEKNPREAAYKRGLWEIVVRVTGAELSMDAPMLEELFPNPARYVLQIRQGANQTLTISFDGDAIENVLRNAGETVWGSDRPLTLVWLAVDWGQGEREIVAADNPDTSIDASRSIDRNRLLRERVQNTAARRGIPVAFPLLDSVDLMNVSFTDVWGGFDDQLLEASRRYQADSVLVGRVRANALQRNRWTFHFRGMQQEWSGEPENAVHMLADALAAEFAYSGNAPIETVSLSIAGIDSVRAYGTVENYLANLSLIEHFEVNAVNGDQIQYLVSLRGGAPRLRRALEISDILMTVEDFDQPLQLSPVTDTRPLEFMYRAPFRNTQN